MDDDQSNAPVRSVKEMAASLARGTVEEESADVKPRRKSEVEKTRSTVNGIRKIVKKKIHKLKELEETMVDGEQGKGSTVSPPLHRQTSHKHVLTTDLALEDVVNV
ncbi:hypothetical protein SK128_012194 [Halocaridina rubra]|uniref:Uncharacterized protein n=1 Tax=Halocaridina rubra TaxID=373956 RepID=A0AAN8XQD2_HALRR